MGGAAKVGRELAASLRPQAEVVEVVFNVADGVDFPGLPPVSLDVAGGGGPADKVMNLARRVARTRRLKRTLGIDISISHLEGAHWVDVLSRAREKVILCVHGSTLHNGDIRGARGWLRSRVVMPLIYNRADRIVTVSRGIAAELVSLGVSAHKISTINNGFDLQAIERLAAKPLTDADARLFNGPPVLITAGRLAWEKNQAALLQVFAGLRRRTPSRLLIAGDGPLRSELIAQARALGLTVVEPWTGEEQPGDADVVFLGVQANPFRFISRSALYVMTSGWEGFPLALCEAMACGTTVVATDCPTGPREILLPDDPAPAGKLHAPEYTPSGVLMPLLHHPATFDRACASWVDVLSDLLAGSERRRTLADNARRRVKAFSQPTVTAQWENLIGRLTAP